MRIIIDKHHVEYIFNRYTHSSNIRFRYSSHVCFPVNGVHLNLL